MRQFQNKISQSVYTVLVDTIRRNKCENEYTILNNVLRHKRTGSEFYFYGIQRNIDEIKGFEGCDIAWIEEGDGLTKEQWKVIEPTIRKEGSEIWLLYNPNLVTDFVETNFKHDPENGVIVRHINYDENPFISDKMLRTINRLKEADYEEYEHIYLGVPRLDDDNVIIKRSWVMAAIDANIKLGIEPSGKKRIGFDVADSGKDKCAEIYVHGFHAVSGNQWKAKEDELMKSCKRVYSKALALGAEVDYDSIGVGALCGSKFNEMNEERRSKGEPGKVSYSKFIANAGVANPDKYYIDTEDVKIKNKDFFHSLKDQSWTLAADRFRNTYNAVTKNEKFEEDEIFSISSDLDDLQQLIYELTIVKKDTDNNGKMKVESKKDLKKRDIESTNYADAYIMANSPHENNVGFFDVDWDA